MIESVLTARNCSWKKKITVKGGIAVGLVVLAFALPQIIHLALGQAGGVEWLPMYLPVLLGGCLLGTWWGLGIGIASPVVSFLLTSLWNSPMPALARLPFMMAELAVFAAVSGLFTKKIAQNGWMAFPAVLIAQVTGRAAFLLLVVIFQSVSSLTPALIWSQIQTGLLGLVVQAVLVPLIVMALRLLLVREGQNDDIG